MSRSTDGLIEPALAVVAHDVRTPIREHRRIEFMNRIVYLREYFSNFFVISRDSGVDHCKIQHDSSTGIIVCRVPSRTISASLYIKEFLKKSGVNVLFADTYDDSHCLLYSRFPRKQHLLMTFLQSFPSQLDALALRTRLGLDAKRSWLESFLRARDSFTFRFFDSIFCVSKSLAHYVESLTPRGKWKDIYYIPHSLEYVKHIPQGSLESAKTAIDEIKESRSLDQDTHILCYVGGLTPNKRPDIAINAFARVIRKRQNSILLVIGDGPLRQQLERLARHLRIQGRVVFIGSQPQYLTIGLISKCSGLIFPSLSEGFSMTIAEALAVGCPVISSAHETAIELGRNGGIVITNQQDPQEFAEKTITVLGNQNIRKEIIKKGRQTISPYLDFKEEDRFRLIATRITEAYERKSRN